MHNWLEYLSLYIVREVQLKDDHRYTTYMKTIKNRASLTLVQANRLVSQLTADLNLSAPVGKEEESVKIHSSKLLALG